MKELNKLKQELLIMKTENIKPNYSELARLHECDRRTIKKYNEGYEGKPIKRNKESRLDKYKEEIKTKLELPGSTIKGTYEYFKNKDDNIGNYSNFYKYSRDFKRNKQNNKFHPRYETEFGKKAKIVPLDMAESVTGHIPGGISPFALKEDVKAYLDVSLKRFDIVYSGGGDEYNIVKCTIPLLKKYSNYEKWIDVCKNWTE